MSNKTVTETESHIEISIDGHTVILDHENRWILDVFPGWYVHSANGQSPYIRVEREIPNPFEYLRQKVMLHRLVFGTKGRESFEIDHINRNKMDNRRRNLRLATPRQNCANRKSKTNKTGFRGVGGKEGKFHVRIGNQKYRKHVGVFNTAEEAARAYDAAAREIYGDFAILNFE